MRKKRVFLSFICLLISVPCLVIGLQAYLHKPADKTDSFIRSQVVLVDSNGFQCTGEQIKAPSGKRFILTAAHCRQAEIDGIIDVVSEKKVRYKVKVIVEDDINDLLLLSPIPLADGLDIAKHLYKNQSIRTFTHGDGHDTYQTDGFSIEKKEIAVPVGPITDPKQCKVGKKRQIVVSDGIFGSVMLCVLKLKLFAMTARVIPGSSGGPILDIYGDLVGVVSATNGLFGYGVPLEDIKRFLKNR